MFMDVGRFIRRQIQDLLGPLVGLTLTGYFAYHLIEGDRGLLAWVRLNQEIRQAKEEAASVHAEREADEHRVSLLRPQHIDPDLLDERARAALNLAAPGEIVILNDDQSH